MKNIILKFFPSFLKRWIYKVFAISKNLYFGGISEGILSSIQGKKLFVFFPTMDWTYHHQRPHHLAKSLAKDPDNIVIYLTHRMQTDRFSGIYLDEMVGVYVCSSVFLVRAIVQKIDFQKIFIYSSWLPNFFLFKFLPKKSKINIIYDYLDQLEVLALFDSTMKKQHIKMLKEADIIFASSELLVESVKKYREDVKYFPNGVWNDDFDVSENEGEYVPDDLISIKAKGRPIIGFYGALADWLDYNLILSALKNLRDFEFVYIGMPHGSSFSSIDFSIFPNYHYLGTKNYSELKYYLKAFDVASIPFQINDITNAVSPVKLFEYWSGGKPVVSTGFKEVMKYSDSVLLSLNSKEYIDNLSRAFELSKDCNYTQHLRLKAKEYDWGRFIQYFND